MDQHSEHDSAGGHGVHLPDPSVWPFVAGFAALLLGFALVWWARDPGSDIAGPFLGAAAVSALIAAAGWSYQDGVMKRKAEEGAHDESRDARYTQVITFAVPEGQLDAARASGGLVDALNGAAGVLHNMAGFQDLRVIVSPATTGPAQVLVETTWSGKDELASYQESQQTILDLIAAHPDDVVTGSVQAFDMEVVRDTKDMAFRFSLASTAILATSLALGGLTLAFGLSVFQEEKTAAGNGGPPPAFDGTIVAQNTLFRQTAFSLPPNTEVTLTLDNREAVGHNIEFFADELGGTYLTGCTSGCRDDTDEVRTTLRVGPVVDAFTFTTPGPGEYPFWCIAHTTEMRGVLIVEEGAPIPGQPPAPPPNGENGDDGEDGDEAEDTPEA